jgi:phosphoribosylaminoimidazolecarboxamide formyltransferase / IMP cyclohydrolase
VKKINSALISVFYKDGLEPIVKTLFDLGVTIYSTGGTAKFIRDLGIDVIDVEALTNYPSILGGRVKTLHPKVFGGILARRDVDTDKQQLKEYDIPEIDLVIVDLYPFEETLKNTENEAEIIEKIDIGGIALIRAAAKNFKDTLVIASRNEYKQLLKLLTEKNGATDMPDRKKFAALAFHVSSHYDTAIFNYFNRPAEHDFLKISMDQKTTLRYGENPHQKGLFFGRLDELFDQLNGKAISYNNLVDIDAAIHLMDEFDETTFAILKHTNSCGLASRENLKEAWDAALAGDPVSAFGGVVICNRNIDKDTAEAINKIFIEVLIAPGYSDEALAILKSKKNRIILKLKEVELPKMQMKTVLNGVIVQDYDRAIEDGSQFKNVTDKRPDERETEDLEFALKAIKHIKSNGITLVKNKQLIGSGTGQTSRVDALKQSIEKAKQFGFDPQGAVLASDAFFPFADSVELAGKAGITSVVQPGGSIRDKDSIDYCNQHGMAMMMTGVRHFKH